MRRVFRWMFRAAVAVVLLLIMTVYVPPLFGLQVYEVGSGSMEPELKTGALVFVRQGQFIQEGDIIAFQLKGQACCVHRCIAVGEDGTYVTKGDNNDEPDVRPVSQEEIIGKAVWSVPYMAYVTAFFRTGPGIGLMAGIFMGAMILELIPERYFCTGGASVYHRKINKNRR